LYPSTQGSPIPCECNYTATLEIFCKLLKNFGVGIEPTRTRILVAHHLPSLITLLYEILFPRSIIQDIFKKENRFFNLFFCVFLPRNYSDFRLNLINNLAIDHCPHWLCAEVEWMLIPKDKISIFPRLDTADTVINPQVPCWQNRDSFEGFLFR
jgi:hypothetical protein